MRGLPGLRISGALLAALCSVALFTTGQAAAAQPSDQRALPASCAANETPNLDGYQPELAKDYWVPIDAAIGDYFELAPAKQYSSGDISGAAYLLIDDGPYLSGTFDGTLSAGNIQIKGYVLSPIGVHEKFSFTGTLTCLMSRIDTSDLKTSGGLSLAAKSKFTSVCPGQGSDPDGYTFACIAEQIRDGVTQYKYLTKETDVGAIQYVYHGGHGKEPGITKGGLDCSGFTRVVDALGWEMDVLGSTYTGGQAAELKAYKDSKPDGSIGDLVYWPGHVGIVIAKNYMLDEPNDGKGEHPGKPPHNLRVDKISTFKPGVTPTYYHLDIP